MVGGWNLNEELWMGEGEVVGWWDLRGIKEKGGVGEERDVMGLGRDVRYWEGRRLREDRVGWRVGEGG